MAMLNNQRVYVQVTIQCTRIDGLSTSPDGEHVFVLFGWQSDLPDSIKSPYHTSKKWIVNYLSTQTWGISLTRKIVCGNQWIPVNCIIHWKVARHLWIFHGHVPPEEHSLQVRKWRAQALGWRHLGNPGNLGVWGSPGVKKPIWKPGALVSPCKP